MRLIGFIGADLAGGALREEGGIGPFMKERVKEEEPDALYVLDRLARALRRLEIDDVTNLWIGDTGVIELAEDEAVGLDEALAAARDGREYQEFADLHVSAVIEDNDLLHVLTISYAQAHDPDEAAFEVMDSAHVLALEPGEDETPDAYEARLSEFLEEYESVEDFAAAYVELEEPFLERLLESLRKELSLWEPETSVDVDQQGMVTMDDVYSTALAISAGAGPA
jgi:hypothetical protein